MEEIVAGALFLAGDGSSYVNGTNLECEGASSFAPVQFGYSPMPPRS
jgi:hypothetical protein